MKLLKLLFAIIICQLAGFIGSLFTTPSIPTWYATLQKPIITPPNWIFAPVWTFLFLLMGISLYLILEKKIKRALTYFSKQLILNILWSVIFFGLHKLLLAFIEIIILWIFIFLTIMSSYKKSKPAAFLLIPYLLWVSFASVLNLFFYIINV